MCSCTLNISWQDEARKEPGRDASRLRFRVARFSGTSWKNRVVRAELPETQCLQGVWPSRYLLARDVGNQHAQYITVNDKSALHSAGSVTAVTRRQQKCRKCRRRMPLRRLRTAHQITTHRLDCGSPFFERSAEWRV